MSHFGRGRLAPSPTGAQHLGNARTYLLAYWAAKASGRELVLRIEDIDSPRVKPGAAEQAAEDLRWLGITWEHGPVRQTERRAMYDDALRRLIDGDVVYPCTCTRTDIEDAGSAPHFDHEPAVYPGTCAGWRAGDEVPPAGTFAWRFRTDDRQWAFVDAVRGRQSCRLRSDLGDFAITQKTGDAAYQLAVVSDDADMNVDQVVRGDDLIASTFRQMAVAEALDVASPSFAHVPLVRGPDGRRLAKRHGDTRLAELRRSGVDPVDIVRWASRSAGFGDDVGHVDDVVPRFSWDRLNRDDVVTSASDWGGR